MDDSGAPLSDLSRPELFINRELSWLEFNQRVLDEARDSSVPLLERLKFLSIVQSNLDEFFMVRVAGLIEQRQEGLAETTADGMSPTDTLTAVSRRVERMVEELADTVMNQVLPLLDREGVRLIPPSDLDDSEQALLRQYFLEQVFPVLTPLALDPGHPFPHVPNKRLHLIVMLHADEGTLPAFAVVQVPAVIPRLIAIPTEHGSRFVLLDAVIGSYVGELFRGFSPKGAWPFRVIRNHDLSIDEEEAEDLLDVIKQEVRRRDRGHAVALEVSSSCPPSAVEVLQQALDVETPFVYAVDSPLYSPDLADLGAPLRNRADLQDAAFTPAISPSFFEEEDPFAVIRSRDVMLHHPYESFDPVVELLERAAHDPDVLAIKQTLYRTSGDSPIVKALMRAAENGKQVAALVEIKARFDEENNINWARRLEEAGVHVVYGLVGLKTHCKVCLIVRRENGRLRRYVHLGTGNYNPKTARLYTDISIFTCREEFGEDATSLFNLLTSCTAPYEWKTLIAAPLGLHEATIGLIEREASYARAGKPARIIAKMNALQDPDVIQALYRASQAGVAIDLMIRGSCCLRPGIPGVSENIRVRSIIDRFLEHHRIYYFEDGGRRRVFCASADWMPRNFHRRVEVMFPVEDELNRNRLITEVLAISLSDNCKTHYMLPDGSYRRVESVDDSEPVLRSQDRFLALAADAQNQAYARAKAERPFVVRPVRNRPTKASVTPPAPLVPEIETQLQRPSDPDVKKGS